MGYRQSSYSVGLQTDFVFYRELQTEFVFCRELQTEFVFCRELQTEFVFYRGYRQSSYSIVGYRQIFGFSVRYLNYPLLFRKLFMKKNLCEKELITQINLKLKLGSK